MEHDEYSRPPFVFCSAADAKEKSPPLTINGNAKADFTEFNLSGKSFSCEHQKLLFPFLILPGRRRRRFRSLLEPLVMNFKGTISLSIARINVVCSITQAVVSFCDGDDDTNWFIRGFLSAPRDAMPERLL